MKSSVMSNQKPDLYFCDNHLSSEMPLFISNNAQYLYSQGYREMVLELTKSEKTVDDMLKTLSDLHSQVSPYKDNLNANRYLKYIEDSTKMLIALEKAGLNIDSVTNNSFIEFITITMKSNVIAMIGSNHCKDIARVFPPKNAIFLYSNKTCELQKELFPKNLNSCEEILQFSGSINIQKIESLNDDFFTEHFA